MCRVQEHEQHDSRHVAFSQTYSKGCTQALGSLTQESVQWYPCGDRGFACTELLVIIWISCTETQDMLTVLGCLPWSWQ